MKTKVKNETSCCPEFHPEPWEDKLFEWDNKKFIRDRVFTFFYMPLNFGRVMKRLDSILEKHGAGVVDWMALSDHTSRWNMDVYLAVDREIPGADNRLLSGKFYSRVYEGPFSDTSKWCSDFAEAAKLKGYSIKKWFMRYTTCPKCAKKYGKNYVTVISQVV